MPRFSIIIPVYNIAPYLRECLDSILTQTFTDWEAICVDDGSTDGSGAILDEYAAKDGRFRAFHQPNAGVSVARNLGLDVAAGEWIYFLDGDDVLIQGALECYNNLCSNNPKVDCFFFPESVPFVQCVPVSMVGDGAVDVVNASPGVGVSLWARKGINGRPYLRLAKRTHFLAAKFPVGIAMMEDRLNLISVLSISSIWATANIKAYGYRRRDDSASSSKSVSRSVEVVGTFYRMLKDSIRLLGCQPSDVVRFWRSSAGVLDLYLRIAIMGAEIREAQKCASMFLEMERISDVRILGAIMHFRCLLVRKYGACMGIRAFDFVERLFAFAKSRIARFGRNNKRKENSNVID